MLDVDKEFVHFNRQNIRLTAIDMPSPKLPVNNIHRIAEVMRGVVHFDYYLSFESDADPFGAQVEVRLHELEQADPTYNTDGLTFADPCQNTKAGEPIRFENCEGG